VRPRIDPANSVFGPGLRLHREIDAFCDGHPVTRECLELLRRSLSRGASIVMDVAYDHFLLAHLADGGDEVIAYAHSGIQSCLSTLPSPADIVAGDVVLNGRLAANRSLDGVNETLRRIVRRRPALPLDPDRAVDAVTEEYALLAELSGQFFDALRQRFQTESSHPNL